MIWTVGMFASYAEPTRNSIELFGDKSKKIKKRICMHIWC